MAVLFIYFSTLLTKFIVFSPLPPHVLPSPLTCMPQFTSCLPRSAPAPDPFRPSCPFPPGGVPSAVWTCGLSRDFHSQTHAAGSSRMTASTTSTPTGLAHWLSRLSMSRSTTSTVGLAHSFSALTGTTFPASSTTKELFHSFHSQNKQISTQLKFIKTKKTGDNLNSSTTNDYRNNLGSPARNKHANKSSSSTVNRPGKISHSPTTSSPDDNSSSSTRNEHSDISTYFIDHRPVDYFSLSTTNHPEHNSGSPARNKQARNSSSFTGNTSGDNFCASTTTNPIDNPISSIRNKHTDNSSSLTANRQDDNSSSLIDYLKHSLLALCAILFALCAVCAIICVTVASDPAQTILLPFLLFFTPHPLNSLYSYHLSTIQPHSYRSTPVKCAGSYFPNISFPPSFHSSSKYLHSIHVLTVSSLILFIFLFFCCPHFISHPPSYPAITSFIPLIPSSVAQSLDSLQIAFLCNSSITRYGLRPSCNTNFLFTLLLLLSGDINLNPGPITSSPLCLAHLNIRSASSITSDLNKPALLQEFLSDYGIDILALTETWLPPDVHPSTLNSITPENYSLFHVPRPRGTGGGVALLYRSFLNISKITLHSFTSFEALCVKLVLASSTYTILTIYRPPDSRHESTFMSEFSTILQDLVPSSSELIITGDFNFHVNKPSLSPASTFLTLLDTYGLVQLITFPTHYLNNTLDLLITRSNSTIFTEIKSIDPLLSDHFAIISFFTPLPLSRPTRITKQIRNFKQINPTLFSNDILTSSIFSAPASTLNAYVSQLSSILSSLLDKYAPLKTVSLSSRSPKPFITPEIRAEKAKRSHLETLYRRNKHFPNSDIFKTNLKDQARKVAKLITSSRRSYFRSLISTSRNQPKKLWAALDSLLTRKSPSPLPFSNSPAELATSFLSSFADKITKLCSAFTHSNTASPHSLPLSPPLPLSFFSPATTDEVRTAILSSSNASCSLDIIPTFFLKSCLEAMIHPITTIINLSFSEGCFPDEFKTAIVTPLLKNHSLPHQDLSSYRPISNLNFISKTLERIIYSRLSSHLISFPSISPFQSAYRKFHSTETALLRIYNDLLLSIDGRKVSALLLLDLSAAFDTIDHRILLDRLTLNFGITDSAHSLLASYLHNRSQSVSIGSHTSESATLPTGVPQGSVLGPLLFSLYTTPLGYIFADSTVSYHFYADDTQLYISFASKDSVASLSVLSSVLDSVHSWFSSNRLSLNPSKTEFLIIGTRQQRLKLASTSIAFCGSTLTPVSKCRNLGVTFDSDLSFKAHISAVCSSSFYHIRRLRQVRSSLDIDSAIVLANSLVSSKLDYCNSLLYHLPDSSIDRLQLVQNALARAVVPSVKKYDHISPTLKKLHWLPIRQRIEFKIASLTFKTLTFDQPLYLRQLLHIHVPSRLLRSSDKSVLVLPLVKSAQAQRSFSFAAPSIWNKIHPSIRSSPSVQSFHKSLKTFLFPP